LGLGLGLANGAGQKQVFQSLHDIRLVKNLFLPGPLNREEPFWFAAILPALRMGPL
jgi:hypothetical protein